MINNIEPENYKFFGQFRNEEELQKAIMNTFVEDPEKYLRAFVYRVINDMRIIPFNGRIMVFWNEEASQNISDAEKDL